MGTDRREFVRWLGMGVAGAAWVRPVAAWAERLRILGGGGGPEPQVGTSGQSSPVFQRFLRDVRVGHTRSYGALRVFWLFGGSPTPAMMVSALEEARARGDILITEREQATVPELKVENRGKSFVLLLAGEILLGGKQNRVLTEDMLLAPGSGPRHVRVYCVEQGRWAGRGNDFQAKGSFAAPGLRSKLMEKAPQARVWDEVNRYARRAGAASPTQSYQEIYEKPEVKAHLDVAEREIDHRSAPGALGAAVFVAESMAGLDLFFDAELFAREWPQLLRAQALDAYRLPRRSDSDEADSRQRVEDVLQAAGKAEGTLRSHSGVGQLFECRLKSQRATALLYEGLVVHAAIL
ncbi:MAG TPA: DUF6569 family protein [Candidatus Methylomirabilis sp.]|nr:DUF6569 family protein [Candidatus Methylomirabilis sp.]